MSTISGIRLTTPKALAKAYDSPKPQFINLACLNNSRPANCMPWKNSTQTRASRMLYVRPVCAAPDNSISDKVTESVKNAEEACSDDPVSGECVAAWDEVEELSAAASHARDKNKINSDPLENYCEDNPETDECRTYDN